MSEFDPSLLIAPGAGFSLLGLWRIWRKLHSESIADSRAEDLEDRNNELLTHLTEQLERSTKDHREEVEWLKKNQRELTERVDKFSAERNVAIAENAKLTERVGNLEKENAELEVEVSQLRGEVFALRTERDNLKEEAKQRGRRATDRQEGAYTFYNVPENDK